MSYLKKTGSSGIGLHFPSKDSMVIWRTNVYFCLGWLSPSRYKTAGTSMGNNRAARPSSSNAMALSGEKKVMYICANIIPAPNSQCLLCQHFFPQLYKILKCY